MIMEKLDFFKTNRRRIANALPHGSVKMLAHAMQCNRATIDFLMNTNRIGDHWEEFMKRALLVIYAFGTDDALVEEYTQAFGPVTKHAQLTA